jgi:hypothetical protein
MKRKQELEKDKIRKEGEYRTSEKERAIINKLPLDIIEKWVERKEFWKVYKVVIDKTIAEKDKEIKELKKQRDMYKDLHMGDCQTCVLKKEKSEMLERIEMFLIEAEEKDDDISIDEFWENWHKFKKELLKQEKV